MESLNSEGLLEAALKAAREAGADYAEARRVRRSRETIAFKKGQMEDSQHLDDVGIGVRVLVRGDEGDGWGYGASNLMDAESVRRAVRGAMQVGVATAGTATRRVTLPESATGDYETPMKEDPFEMTLAAKAAPFFEAHDTILQVAGVSSARGGYMGHRQETLFMASNGSVQRQKITLCGGGISAIAQANGDVQTRSYPKAHEGNLLQGGFEGLRASDLEGNARRVAEEAVALTQADPTPRGSTTVILNGSQLSLQIHESVGHPTELDRVMGEEISLAGASFLLPENLDTLQFGSNLVNLTADATTPLGPGTFAFDDEGTPATRTPLVSSGRFVGYLSGRDSAARLDRVSGSCLRAESWSRQPIVRMINVNLEPGEGSLDDLIGGVDDGLLLDVNKSWSIDDLRLNFQFSCEIAYEIKAGRLTGRIFKNPIYYGVTPQFWGGCSAIAGAAEHQMWGWAFCGKGDPGQVMYVGHGCAPARFDGIEVSSS